MQFLFICLFITVTFLQLVLCATPTLTWSYSDFVTHFRNLLEEITKPTPSSSYSYAPQSSPIFPGLNSSKSRNSIDRINLNGKTLSTKPLDLKQYPVPWTRPDIHHPQVKAAIKSIDWNIVPKSKVRTYNGDGGMIFESYNYVLDPDCWWSATNCVSPKITNVPKDIYTCPNKGDWGLTFDDGPFNVREKGSLDALTENPYAEPELYNFMAKYGIKSDLFYIGSNVVNYPAAAKKAFDDGHVICSHTWSHTAMTTLQNADVVAELYWSLRAIKDATGVTPKCWRPPQGDVDDRVRSIAWQMGLQTILWDFDTEDWSMPAPGGGWLAPAKVDQKISKWVREKRKKTQTHGTIVLQHELNSATIRMAEKWLPKIKKYFKIMPASVCNGITQPYWEVK